MELPYILNIDTSTDICSAALTKGNEVIAYLESCDGKSHAKTLLPYIQELLDEAHLKPQDLNAVALSMGPGSYTGLRIGTSTAKGICYTMDIPLIAIPTLQIIAVSAVTESQVLPDSLICPLLDARRMEVFTAVYQTDLQEVTPVSSQIIDENSFNDILSEKEVIFCGNGVEKCRNLLEKNTHAHFNTDPISAKNMSKIAYQKFENRQFEDVAYFEPFYLKE